MNERANPDAYGVLTEPATLTIQRMLPGPIERVWAYLTESDLRRKWLAAGEMEREDPVLLGDLDPDVAGAEAVAFEHPGDAVDEARLGELMR